MAFYSHFPCCNPPEVGCVCPDCGVAWPCETYKSFVAPLVAEEEEEEIDLIKSNRDVVKALAGLMRAAEFQEQRDKARGMEQVWDSEVRHALEWMRENVAPTSGRLLEERLNEDT